MRLLPFVALLSGCVLHVSGLEPRPNLPGVTSAPSVCVKLDDRILQKTQVGNVVLDTWRGDLKRGFLNGFPGAVKGTKAELSLALDAVDPTVQCFQYVGCVARLRFKGRFNDDLQGELVSFAGESASEICNHDLDDCYTGAIERMYEQIFEKTRHEIQARLGERPAKSVKTSEL
jgi:hypothetical protein